MLRAASPMPLFEDNLSHRVALTEAISVVMMRRTALHGLIDLALTVHGPNVSWKSFIATSLADHIPLNAGRRSSAASLIFIILRSSQRDLPGRGLGTHPQSVALLLWWAPFIADATPTGLQFGAYRF